MPEMLTPTSAIMGAGLGNDVAMVTDGRFSGGSHGFIIGHVTPEAQVNFRLMCPHFYEPFIMRVRGSHLFVGVNKDALGWVRVREFALFVTCNFAAMSCR